MLSHSKIAVLMIISTVLLPGCQTAPENAAECYRLTYATGRVHEVCRQGDQFRVRDVEGIERPNAEGALKRSLDTVRNIEHGMPLN